MTAVALGWRIGHTSAVVVAVSSSAASPTIAHREAIVLIDDEVLREPYHAALAVPFDDAPALIESVEAEAAAAAEATIRRLSVSIGPVDAVGVVGGTRRLPELSRILTKHALLHAAERGLYEQAFIDGATRAGLPVTTVPATGKIFDHASELLGVDVKTLLAAVGKTIGPPWQKDHREATAAALVALNAVRDEPAS